MNFRARRNVLLVGIALYCGAICLGQNFDLVEVHSSGPNSIAAMRSGFSGGRYEVRNATMLELVRTAWNVDGERVWGGPDWLDIDRFDVLASAPPNSSRDALRGMLRETLQTRFGLVAHEEVHDFPAAGIFAGQRPLLQAAEKGQESGCGLSGAAAGSVWTRPGELVEVACRNVSIEQFAGELKRLRGTAGYLFNYPVVDRTGLAGSWDFQLHWTMRASGMQRPAEGSSVTLQEALEKELGLRLEMVRIPGKVIVVDQVKQRPTANSGEADAKLRAPATEFEVATIKLASPDDPQGSHVGVQKGGLVRIVMTLPGLIEEAWSFAPERIVGIPKGSGINSRPFSITAKAPVASLDAGPAVFSGVDIDGMRNMLKALLVERFQLVSHEEERSVPGYALVGGTKKLVVAAKGNRPGCHEGPGADGKDPRLTRPLITRMVSCRNVTLADFARELRRMAGEYLEPAPPIVDATGLKGRYDISVAFSARGAIQNAVKRGADGEVVALDPNGAISLFEALQGQLGLRLEKRKVTAPVLVIERVAEMPVGN